jgi:hypothetical protein
MAVVLPTICGMAGCSTKRTEHAPLDRSVMAECPREILAPGALVEREILVLEDGRQVVPFGNAVERENMLLRGALVYREGYRACRSVVIYVEQRDEALDR